MNLLELTTQQLRRAAAIKERIEDLNRELQRILDTDGSSSDGGAPKKRTMSASVKKKIAAAQRARWAKVRGAKPTSASSAQRQPRTSKKKFTPATRAKLSAKLKAYWAARKARQK